MYLSICHPTNLVCGLAGQSARLLTASGATHWNGASRLLFVIKMIEYIKCGQRWWWRWWWWWWWWWCIYL